MFKIILDKKRLIRVYIMVGEITLKYKREKKSPHISFISSTYDFQLRKKGVAQLQKKKKEGKKRADKWETRLICGGNQAFTFPRNIFQGRRS